MHRKKYMLGRNVGKTMCYFDSGWSSFDDLCGPQSPGLRGWRKLRLQEAAAKAKAEFESRRKEMNKVERIYYRKKAAAEEMRIAAADLAITLVATFGFVAPDDASALWDVQHVSQVPKHKTEDIGRSAGEGGCLFVKTGFKVITIDFISCVTISDIKTEFEAKTGIRASEYRLIFEGKQLEDSLPLFLYAIQRDSTIELVGSLRGGGGFDNIIDSAVTTIATDISEATGFQQEDIQDLLKRFINKLSFVRYIQESEHIMSYIASSGTTSPPEGEHWQPLLSVLRQSWSSSSTRDSDDDEEQDDEEQDDEEQDDEEQDDEEQDDKEQDEEQDDEDDNTDSGEGTDPPPSYDLFKDPPPSYDLFKIGDKFVTLDGTTFVVTKEHMLLLGSADNSLFKIPRRLIPLARAFLAAIYTMNETIMPFEEKLQTPMFKNADQSFSNLSSKFYPFMGYTMDTGCGTVSICRLEQSGKSAGTANLSNFLRLRCGAVPVVSVRSNGGRMISASEMRDSLAKILSKDLGTEKGYILSVKDVLRVLLARPEHSHIDFDEACSYFCIEPEVVELQADGIVSRILPVILANEANIKRVREHLCLKLVETVGYIMGPDGVKHALAFGVHDEADAMCEQFRKGCVDVFESSMGDVVPFMMEINISATIIDTLVAPTLPDSAFRKNKQLIVAKTVPYNYYGIDDVCPPNRRAILVKYNNAPRPRRDQILTLAGTDINTFMNKPAKGKGLLLKGLVAGVVHMKDNPNHHFARWRHGTVNITNGHEQNALAKFFASACGIFTMEWHGTGVVDNHEKAAVRLFIPKKIYNKLVAALGEDHLREILLGGRSFFHFPDSNVTLRKGQAAQHLHTKSSLLQAGIISELCTTSRMTTSVYEFAYDATMTLRKGLDILQTIRTEMVTMNICLLCFAGKLNGRQIPNKPTNNKLGLTDYFAYLNREDGIIYIKGCASPTDRQAMCRLNGIAFEELKNRLRLHVNTNGYKCVLQYQKIVKEFAEASYVAGPQDDWLGFISEERTPLLHAYKEHFSNAPETQTIKITHCANKDKRESLAKSIVSTAPIQPRIRSSAAGSRTAAAALLTRRAGRDPAGLLRRDTQLASQNVARVTGKLKDVIRNEVYGAEIKGCVAYSESIPTAKQFVKDRLLKPDGTLSSSQVLHDLTFPIDSSCARRINVELRGAFREGALVQVDTSGAASSSAAPPPGWKLLPDFAGLLDEVRRNAAGKRKQQDPDAAPAKRKKPDAKEREIEASIQGWIEVRNLWSAALRAKSLANGWSKRYHEDPPTRVQYLLEAVIKEKKLNAVQNIRKVTDIVKLDIDYVQMILEKYRPTLSARDGVRAFKMFAGFMQE